VKNKVYACIDLKSFYASVECVERGLDPFKTNLVVADPDREEGTICLAITPAMKALGVKNRCRVFEIPKGIEYIKAKPRMRLYMEKSAEIYSVYLEFISPDDIHVYSIDECFFDLTPYLKLYKKTPEELVDMLRREVFLRTGISASAGIGTNLFLAKVAMDIIAKKTSDGVGYLDEKLFLETVAHHRPITDIWNIGVGIAKRLSHMGIFDLDGVRRAPPELLYKEFGVNAEYLIDHAWGRESCTIADIKAYRPRAVSHSNSQVLFEPYSFEDGKIILREMVEDSVLDIIGQGLATDRISLSVGYCYKREGGEIVLPKSTGGSAKLPEATSSLKTVLSYFEAIYDKTTDKEVPLKRFSVSLGNLVSDKAIPINIFSDSATAEKETALLHAVSDIKKRFGKNAILKGVSYTDKATSRARNLMVGGHNAE
jgi:DNA polymerase V